MPKCYSDSEREYIRKRLNPEDVELLARRLPGEIVAEHFGNDTDTLENVLALLPVKEGLDTEILSAAFHTVYFSTLHKAEIGEAHYDAALHALIHGLVSQMF